MRAYWRCECGEACSVCRLPACPTPTGTSFPSIPPSPRVSPAPVLCTDLIFSTDVTNTVNEPGDQGLDLEGDAGVDVNTGARACVQPNRLFNTINQAPNHAMNCRIDQSVGQSTALRQCSLLGRRPSLPLGRHSSTCSTPAAASPPAGVYLMRAGNGTAAWAHAWRGYFDKCPDHDQARTYGIDLGKGGGEPRGGSVHPRVAAVCLPA